MKLAELFASPTSNGKGSTALVFDNGDLVDTPEGPGQIMSAPNADGCYKVKLKTGKTAEFCGTDLKLATR